MTSLALSLVTMTEVAVQGVEVELLPANHSIAWEQGWSLPAPIDCIAGFGEVIDHVAVLLLRRGDDRHNALSKTISDLALGACLRVARRQAEAALTPERTRADLFVFKPIAYNALRVAKVRKLQGAAFGEA